LVDAVAARGRRGWIFQKLKDRVQRTNRNPDVSEEPGDRVRLRGRGVVTGKPYCVVEMAKAWEEEARPLNSGPRKKGLRSESPLGKL
jgi:hypothetical protein